MKLNKFQKAKVVLGLSLLALLFAILFIPHIVDHGLSWASEDTLETLFLILSFFAVIYVFWHYDYVVQKREQETLSMSSKLQSKEKELIEAFQYLGKINVRFSVVRDFLEKIKKPIPKNKEEMKRYLKEMLEIACGATGRKKAYVKIVDLKSKKLLIEESLVHEVGESEKIDINTRDLLSSNSKDGFFDFKNMRIFCSGEKKSKISICLILPIEEGGEAQDDFLKALVNQCKMVFSIYNKDK